MVKYIKLDERAEVKSSFDRFKQFLHRTFRGELFVGLWVVLREMLKKNNSHTILYPMEKFELSDRYRGIHKLLRLLESGNERCIGCGLCEKICVSNCIRMETTLGDDGRKKVLNYSINFGRCVYCGLCADVCPELAIVHGGDYEFASEQRAFFGFKKDLLTKYDELKNQKEFTGFGSLPGNVDDLIKLTPTVYTKKVDENV